MLPSSVQAVLSCFVLFWFFHAREVARASLGSQTVVSTCSAGGPGSIPGS